MLAGQAVGTALQVFYFLLLARLLGTAEYGIYAGVFALVTMASQYSTLGAGTLLLRYVSADATLFSVYWGNALISTIGTNILIMAGLTLATPYIFAHSSTSLVLVSALSVCFFNQLIVCAGQVFQTFELLGFTALMNALASALRVIAATILMLTIHRITAWQWSLAFLGVSFIASVIAITAVSVRFGPPKFNATTFLRRGAEGFQYSFASSTATVYNDIDKTILGHYGMNAANGVYSMAYRIIDMATMPITSMRDAAMPVFFQRGAAGLDGARTLAGKLGLRSSVFGLLMAVVLFAVAPVIPRVVGHEFTGAVSAVRWLSVIPALRGVHQMTGSALVGAGLQRYRTTTQVLAAVMNLVLNVPLITKFGWLGAAWASIATDASLAGMNCLVLVFARPPKRRDRSAVAQIKPAISPVQS